VSWSGDGIEKFVWGREALAWSVAARRVKSPVQQSTKVKDQYLIFSLTLSMLSFAKVHTWFIP